MSTKVHRKTYNIFDNYKLFLIALNPHMKYNMYNTRVQKPCISGLHDDTWLLNPQP